MLLDCHSSDLMTWTMKMNYLQRTKMYTFSVAVCLSWMEKLSICVSVCVCVMSLLRADGGSVGRL